MTRARAWLSVAIGLALSFVASNAAVADHALIGALDADRSLTLDLAEIRKAAGDTFERLDRDHDGTIEPKEIGPRISKRDFASADAGHDGTLTKDEFTALAERLFRAADEGGHGELGEKELQNPAGKLLARLLR